MADIAVTTAGRVHVVGIPEVQRTLNADEAILAGDAVRIIPSSTGAAKFTKANASGTLTGVIVSGEAQVYGIATRSVPAGQAVTAIRKGRMSGWTISQGYGAPVFLSDTDGRIADADGTVNILLGHIVPTTANPRGDAEDKIIEFDITGIPV
jgi:hypothetical protein